MRELRRFFKANPQVLVLLLICLVLGIGTFLAVLFGIVTSRSTTTSGDPSGSVLTPLIVTSRSTTTSGDPSGSVLTPLIVTSRSTTTSGDPSGSVLTPRAARPRAGRPYAMHQRPGSDILTRVWLD